MDDLIFALDRAGYRFPGAATPALSDLTITVRRGELVGLAGPNGSGKTTLVRLLLGVLTPSAGSVLALGQPAHTWDRRALARQVGVVVQREEPAFPLRVREAVMLGRYPHLGPVGAAGERDHAAVDRALALCDIAELGGRWINTLSGGEWQRVRVARALAQEPTVLVLDEPTANLDLRHEMEVFELVTGLVRRQGITALIVTHHLNLAARFADRLVLLDRGAARAIGAPAEVMTRAVLEPVFGRAVDVTPWRGTPQFVPLKKGE
jgi:iron complex transport system ATP-binding protein